MHSITDFLNGLLANSGSLSLWQGCVAVLIAYLGGVLSSLTPCVYPMIPITVGVVGGIGSAKRSWHEIVVRGLVYISGMTVIYSFLGVVAGLTGRVFGSLTNTPGWYLTLGGIMTLAALWMLDVIAVDPVALWDRTKLRFRNLRHRLAGQARESRHVHHATPIQNKEMTLLGAFALGASSGFIAAPCTTPVLTAILAYIAKTQSIGLGLALMIGFSFGLGTLLLLIGGFTGALQILPKSGAWMKRIKIASGVLLLVFAEYLIFQAGKLGGF